MATAALADVTKQLRKNWSVAPDDLGRLQFEYREARPRRTIVRGFTLAMAPDHPNFNGALRAQMNVTEKQIQKEIKEHIWD